MAISARLIPQHLGFAAMIVPLVTQAQTEAVFDIGRYVFEGGGEIPSMKVGYVTWGTLDAGKDNAILLVPGTSGSRHSYDAYIGLGKAYDTDKYLVIAADPIGGGNSSQPKDGMGTRFPEYTIRDMVRVQHEFVTRGLGLTRLLAVGGSSMGSFQGVEWGINFPDFMRGLILIVPAARSDNHFGTICDAFFAMITLDPNFQGGGYTVNPVEGIRRAALIYFPWASSDDFLATFTTATLATAQQAAADAWATAWDANSMMSRCKASKLHDASKPFGGDMMKALPQIKAKALLLPSMTDRGLRDATYAEIPSIRGHSAGGALVNNAGSIVQRTRLTEAGDALIDQVFHLNARSMLAMCRAVLPSMQAKRRGAIINVTSQAARTGGSQGTGLYASTKAYISTFTRALAKEVVADGIRVNGLLPGVIQTPIHDRFTAPELMEQLRMIPMGRIGRAEECVGTVLSLASDDMSSYVTRQIIEVNGGLVMP